MAGLSPPYGISRIAYADDKAPLIRLRHLPLHGEKGAAARGGVAQACEVGALFRSERQ